MRTNAPLVLHLNSVTFEEYRSWTGPERYELLEGTPYLMSPAPSLRHQAIITAAAQEFRLALRTSACRAYVSPVDVKLSDRDVVQPDLVVVCNPAQERTTHIEGPPALVLEVLSPSSRSHDRIRKLRLYAQFSVPEYWIVDPEEPGELEILVLDGATYRVAARYPASEEEVTSVTLPELKVSLVELFRR